MTLQKRVEYCSKNLGIKKGHIAMGAGICLSDFSSWLHGNLRLYPYKEKRIEDFVSNIEKVEPYLKVVKQG